MVKKLKKAVGSPGLAFFLYVIGWILLVVSAITYVSTLRKYVSLFFGDDGKRVIKFHDIQTHPTPTFIHSRGFSI